MNSNKNTRLEQLDLLKATAIILVVFYHSYSAKDLDIVASGTFVSHFNYCLMGVLGISVPLFFMVNGYLLLSKELDLKKLVRKILGLILFTAVWGVLNIMALLMWRGGHMGVPEILKTLWRQKEGWVSHLWFLGALGVAYIFFPLIKTAYDANKKVFYFFFAAAFLLTFGNKFLNMAEDILRWILFGSCKQVDDIRNYFNMFNALQGINGFAIVYFMWGGILAEKRRAFLKKPGNSQDAPGRRDMRRKLVAVLVLVMSIIMLDCYAYLKAMGCGNWYDIVWYGYDSVFTFLAMTAFYVCTVDYQKKGMAGRSVEFMSRNTMGIYLIHIMLIEGMKPLLDLCEGGLNILARLAVCAVTVVASGLLSELLSCIPGLRRLIKL